MISGVGERSSSFIIAETHSRLLLERWCRESAPPVVYLTLRYLFGYGNSINPRQHARARAIVNSATVISRGAEINYRVSLTRYRMCRGQKAAHLSGKPPRRKFTKLEYRRPYVRLLGGGMRDGGWETRGEGEKEGDEAARHWRSYSFGESEGAAGAHLAGEETSREYPQPLFLPGRPVRLALPSPFIDPSSTTTASVLQPTAAAPAPPPPPAAAASPTISIAHRASLQWLPGHHAGTTASIGTDGAAPPRIASRSRRRVRGKESPRVLAGSRPTRRPGAHEPRRTGASERGCTERAVLARVVSGCRRASAAAGIPPGQSRAARRCFG